MHHDQPTTLAALGRTWIEAWNARDLERVLTLYAEDVVMTSDRIPAMGFDASGTVRGKDALRAYWGKALELLPELRFSLIDVFVSLTAWWCFTPTSGARRSASICG